MLPKDFFQVFNLSGNINASMAKAVENAMVICPFMTEAYESSESCELELNYAKDSQVQVCTTILGSDF